MTIPANHERCQLRRSPVSSFPWRGQPKRNSEPASPESQRVNWKLGPKTDFERALRLVAMTYEVSLLQLQNRVSQEDEEKVREAFRRATLEAAGVEVSRIGQLEEHFLRKNARYLEML